MNCGVNKKSKYQKPLQDINKNDMRLKLCVEDDSILL